MLSAYPVPAEEASPLQSLIRDVRHDIRSSPSSPSSSTGWRLPNEGLPVPACGQVRILRADERPAACGGVALATAVQPEASGSDTPVAGPEVEPKTPSRFWTYAIPTGVLAGSAANTLLETPHQSFHSGNEGWFGQDTYAGGADKASHFVDYYIVSEEIASLYEALGYSRPKSIWIGLGVSLLAGVVNEFGDGFNRYGFSHEDLTMDTAGAISAAVIARLGANDLIGFRRGFLLPPYSTPGPPDSVGDAYQNQIFTTDLKLAGAARRLNVNIGPLRYLLASATYATKGYATGVPDLRERQVGFEIGLNLEEILNSVGVRRNVWWGYTLHFVLDNVRVPFTSVGFQYDLNSGRWYGPGNGNGFSTQ